MAITFHTTVVTAGLTATGIIVPEKIMNELGGGGRPLVKITINGYTYRSAIAKRGDRYMFGISADVRQAAHVAGGDEIDVALELDTEPREVTVPPALAQALAKHPKAKAAFEKLSNSKKKLYINPIEQAKTDETQQRNVRKALDGLGQL